MNSTAQLAIDPKLSTGPPLKTALKIVSRSTETRASNEARAWLVVADVTPTGYRVGKFLASHARYATAADVRRHVVPGEIFCYWRQATIAAEMGCSERQVRRGVRSLREAGALDVRRRVRPCEASYVFHASKAREGSRGCDEGATNGGSDVLSDVRSGVLSGVRSHTEPRTEPRKNHGGSSRARVVCPECRHDWLAEDRDGKSYGTKCYNCGHDPLNRDTGRRRTGRRAEGVYVRRRLQQQLRASVCGLRGRAQPSAACRCSSSAGRRVNASTRGD